MRHLQLFLSIFLFLVCVISNAQSLEKITAAGGEEKSTQISKDEARKILREVVPNGATPEQLANFYRKQETAAFQLGEFNKVIEIDKAWLEAMPEQLKFSPLWQLWAAEYAYGDPKKGLDYGEQTLRLAKSPIERGLVQSQLSAHYIFQYNFGRAQELIDAAQNTYKNEILSNLSTYNSTQKCQASRIELTYYLNQARILRDHGKNEKALDLINELLTKNKLVDICTDAIKRTQTFALNDYSVLLSVKVSLLVNLNRTIDAEYEFRKYVEFCKKNGLYDANKNGIVMRLIHIKMAEGNWKVVEQLSLRELNNLGSEAQINFRKIEAFKSLRMAYIGLGKWPEDLSLITTTDSLIGSNATFKNMWWSGKDHALVYLNNNQVADAIRDAKIALNNHEKRFGPNHFYTAQVAGILGMALFRSGDNSQAKIYFDRALKGILQPVGVSEQTANLGYNKIYSSLILFDYLKFLAEEAKAGNVESLQLSFQIGDFLRSSVTQQAILASASRSSISPQLGSLLRERGDLINQMSAGYSQIESMMDRGVSGVQVDEVRKAVSNMQLRSEALSKDIARQFPDFEKLIKPDQPKLKEIAGQLGADEALVSVFVTPDYAYVWGISKSAPPALERIDIKGQEVEKLANNLRNSLDVSSKLGGKLPSFDVKSASELYSRILAPVEQLWRGKKTLIFASSGALSQIPIETLVTKAGESNTTPPSQLSWLMRDIAIAYTPSVSGWLALKKAKSSGAKNPYIGFADPIFNMKGGNQKSDISKGPAIEVEGVELVNSIEYSQLPPLPETRAESLAIAKALNTNPDQTVYWGARASKATVQSMSLSDYKIVAFATHGLIPGDFPKLNQPALALSVNNENVANPLLTMDDIMKLKLNADLVVLSACNTASADGKADEAFSGLARGFFYAGTRAILATEWPVETNSAKKLMETLFGNHAQDPKRSIAESLQKAQLSFLNTEYAHPFYWAPYILIGDGVR